MKKESKSLNLFKISFICLIFVAILTWIIPTGNFETGPFVNQGLVRTSIYDFLMTYYYAILYLLMDIVFLLCVGGLYGVLSKSREYSAIVSSIANKIKGHENIFIVLIGLLFALFTSININVLFCVAFIPFIVSILAKNGINKFKTFAATFGSIMIGIVGMTFNQYYGAVLVDVMPVALTDGLVWKFLILGVSFFIMMSFVLMKIDGPKSATLDMYSLVESDKKIKKGPLAILLIIFTIISLLAFVPWKEAFGIELFDKMYDSIMTFKVGGKPIMSYLFDNQLAIYPNGSYDKIFDMTLLMLIVSFITSRISKMRINYYLTSFGNGIKKILKPVSIFLLVNCVFVLAYWSPMGSYIVNELAPSGSSFNILLLMLIALILSVLNIDHGYTLYSVGAYIGTLYITNIVDTALIMNTVYGVVQFIVPTSYLLFFALSYLDISYKDYLKNMWKYILALVIAVFIILLMSVYI